MKPFRRLSRWYARKYVCPFWGHKPADGSWWNVRNGMVSVIGRVERICENCGEVISDEDAR